MGSDRDARLLSHLKPSPLERAVWGQMVCSKLFPHPNHSNLFSSIFFISDIHWGMFTNCVDGITWTSSWVLASLNVFL